MNYDKEFEKYRRTKPEIEGLSLGPFEMLKSAFKAACEMMENKDAFRCPECGEYMVKETSANIIQDLQQKLLEAIEKIKGQDSCLRKFMENSDNKYPLLTEKLLEVKQFLGGVNIKPQETKEPNTTCHADPNCKYCGCCDKDESAQGLLDDDDPRVWEEWNKKEDE